MRPVRDLTVHLNTAGVPSRNRVLFRFYYYKWNFWWFRLGGTGYGYHSMGWFLKP